MVVKTAAMGKAGAAEGDTLADPTTKVEYDVLHWKNSGGTQPVFVHAMAREKHGDANPRWQESYSYSDSFGREVMKKVQAEPGEVPILDSAGRLLRNADGSPQTRLATSISFSLGVPDWLDSKERPHERAWRLSP